MIAITAKLQAIFWRDLMTATSYRLGFLMQLTAPMFMIISFYFVGRLLKNASIPGLDQYGGDYFGFVLVGLVFTTYIGIALSTVASTTRRGQMLGTLEVVLTTQTSLATFLMGSSLYAIARATVFVAVYLVAGALLFGVDFTGANVPAGLLVLFLSMAVMLGLGILSGSFIIMFKQGDPLGLLVNSGAFLLSGVAYPVEVLPRWLQVGSAALPHTYALEALRMGLLQGASIGEILPELRALTLFAVVILPLSLLAFRYAVYRARTEGGFSQF